MTREAAVLLTGLALLAAGVTGCTHRDHAGSGEAKIVIDGQDQRVEQAVSCTKSDQGVAIVVGDESSGNVALVTDADPPEVKSVTLDNGHLLYLPGQGDATATRTDQHYTITGTGTTADADHPEDMSTKPFTFEVTCP